MSGTDGQIIFRLATCHATSLIGAIVLRGGSGHRPGTSHRLLAVRHTKFFPYQPSRHANSTGTIGHEFGKVPRDAVLRNSLLTSTVSYPLEIHDSFRHLRVNMLVAFGLVTKMDMLVGTVGAGMFVRVTGGVSYVLMLVRVAVRMIMAMDVLMFMRMDLAPMGVLVGMTVYMLMAVFVGPFHFCLLVSEPHCRLFRY